MLALNVRADSGAIGNGSTDDWAAIQSALDAVGAAGGGSVYLPSGTYLCSRGLSVASNTHLYGDGAGTVIVNPAGVLPQLDIAGTRVYATISAVGTSGVTISDLCVDHSTYGCEANGIQIGTEPPGPRTTGTVIENTIVHGFNAHQYLIFNMRADDTVIRNNTVDGHASGLTGGYAQEGIEVFGGSNIQIYGNTARNIANTGILVHEDATVADTAVSAVSIHDNVVIGGEIGLDLLVASTGGNFDIHDNRFLDNANRGIMFGTVTNGELYDVSITHNEIARSGNAGIAYDIVGPTLAHDIVVSQNTIHDTVNFGSLGIYADGANAVFSGNTIQNANYRGILLDGANHISVVDNAILGTGREAIMASGGGNITIDRNDLRAYGLFGEYGAILAAGGVATGEIADNIVGRAPDTTPAIHAYYSTGFQLYGNTDLVPSAYATPFLNSGGAATGPNILKQLPSQAAWAGSAFTLNVPASTFGTGNGALTYTATLADGSPLPAWLTFNASSKTFSGTPGSGNTGALAINLKATDGTGHSATSAFVLTVAPPGGLTAYSGSGGNDWADLSSFNSAVWINLGHHNYEIETRDQSYVNTGPNPFRTLADLDAVRNVTGTAYNDDITGDVSNNILYGGGGDDLFGWSGGSDVVVGGSGTDTLSYAQMLGSVRADLTTWAITKLDASGNATGTDYASGFEIVEGTAGSDNFKFGGSQFLTINGGGGNDTADFTKFASAIWADLGHLYYEVATRDQAYVNTGPNPFRNLADLNAIENITGTAFNDDLAGDSAANTISAGAGADIVRGSGGNDVLDGGTGANSLTYETLAGSVAIDVAGTVTKYSAAGALVGSDQISNFGNFTGTAGNDKFTFGGTTSLTFNGGAGIDTADFSNFASAIWGDLTHTNFEVETRDQSYVNTGPKAFRNLADFSSIENITGTAFNDELYGDANDNVIAGGAGSDILDGRGGTDTLSYAGQSGYFAIDLTTSTVTEYSGAGLVRGTDRISNFEAFTGSSGNDTLVFGGNSFLTFNGGGGSDTADFSKFASAIWVDLSHLNYEVETRDQTYVNSGPNPFRNLADLNGVENVTGTAFRDDIAGDAQDNAISAGLQSDLVWGSGGSDTLDGGGGNDALTYATLSRRVAIDLAQGITNKYDTGGAITGTDHISNFEAFTGGSGNDALVFGGNNFLTFDGGAGSDTADFSQFASAIWADLSHLNFEVETRDQGYVNTGPNAFRNLADLNSVENITGTAYADEITGDGQNNVLNAGGGADLVRGGIGSDTLDGGSGTDALTYASLTGRIEIDLAQGIATKYDVGGTVTGTDHVSNFEDITGTSGDDAFGFGGSSFLSFDGGAGNDTADFSQFASAIWADLSHLNFEVETRDQAYVNTGPNDFRALANLNSVENLTGTAFNDQLFGDANANILAGGGGNDFLSGGGGADTFIVAGPAQGLSTIAGFLQGEDRLAFDAGQYGHLPGDAISLIAISGGLQSAPALAPLSFAYDTANGDLYFIGANLAGTVVANLQNAPSLSASDIVML